MLKNLKRFEGVLFMDLEKRQNIKIVGDNSSAGGLFNNVSVVGNGIFNSPVDCVYIKVAGDCMINGDLKSVTGVVAGSINIKGSLSADMFKVAGNMTVDDNTSIKNLITHGNTTIRGNISSEKIDANGYFTIEGNCNSEVFKSKSIVMKLNGLLNADEIDIQIYGGNFVQEIGGEKIMIRRGSESIFKRLKLIKSMLSPHDMYKGNLTTDTIEGDEIYLEYTTAKVVRGKNVTIGKGCNIELVEYVDDFNQHNDSVVRESKKIIL
jgi:cytoskeletal protein CcmA (bactofilin family)